MKTTVSVPGIVAIAFLGTATTPVCAQTSGLGAIVSSVRDAAGHAVAGALVVATGPTTRDATTNSAGIVTLLGLPAGRYTVRVTRAGFASYTQVVKIGAQADGVKTLNVLVMPQNFATAGGEFSSTTAGSLDHTAPYVAPAVTDSVVANIVTSLTGTIPFATVGPTLEGTGLNETRVELDGIPLAGGAAGADALRFRSALDLGGISFVEGPGLSSPSLQNAIGGIVDYQTIPITPTLSSGYEYGYDSVFGSFGQARYSNTFGGKVGVALDAVGGFDANESAAIKTRIDLSRSTSVSFASYADRSTYATNATTVVSDAPAYSADFRTMLARTTLDGRLFESRSDMTEESVGLSNPMESFRTNGFTVNYAVPFGENAFSIGYDRRVERYALGESPEALESIATLRLATEIQLTRTSRVELGDDVSTGSFLPHRNDPQIALVVHPENALTLRFAAGSAYATVPEQLVSTVSPASVFAPESSFGYRAGADLTTHAGDHVRLAAFALRRFDDFSALSQGRSQGLDFDFERQALPGRVGVDAGIAFSRTYEFGTVQPYARYATAEQSIAGAQLDGDPFTKAHLALTYRVDEAELHAGTTLVGANNTFGDRAVTLGNVSLLVPVAPIGNMRIGIENMFGATGLAPAVASLYPPRELTLTFER